MKRANETLVGAAVLGAIVLAVAGSVFFSQARFGVREKTHAARFRAIGGLQKGNPVVVRGVRIGRVSQIALARGNWVDVTLLLTADTLIPDRPAAIVQSTTLFGDWGVNIVSLGDSINDPEVRRQLDEAAAAGRNRWPGATLPDIGQLTAQAGRIAGDIANIAGRVEATFDSTSSQRIKSALLDLSNLSRRMSMIARSQETTLTAIGRNLDTGSTSLARGARALEHTLARADSATSGKQLQSILGHTDTITSELRQVAANLREVTGAAAAQQAAIGRIIANTDSLIGQLQAGHGTLGKVLRDPALYDSTLAAMKSLQDLLRDVKSNPRRYFSFSVF